MYEMIHCRIDVRIKMCDNLFVIEEVFIRNDQLTRQTRH